MGKKNKKIDLPKDVLYDLYVNQQLSTVEIAALFDCTSVCIAQHLQKYGIPRRKPGEGVKLQRQHWSPEKEQQRSMKFKQTWHDTPDDVKKEIIAKRTKNSNSPESIQKAINTRTTNKTGIKSKAENKFFNDLVLVFGVDDVIHEYTDSEQYPFQCDFYIKSKNLFIEYQGHFTHGYEPYNPENIDHEDYLNLMRDKNIDTKTWTVRDPKKLNYALTHNTNLLLIYPNNDSYLVKNGNLTNVGKISAIDINDIG